MANTWPTTSGGSIATGYLATGTTTLRWGTIALLQSPKPASGFYVVTNFKQRPLVENIKLGDGMGWTETRVLLVDGCQWEVTVRDDTLMTPPVEGTTVVMTDAAGMINNATRALDAPLGVLSNVNAPASETVFNATVVDPSYAAAPKEPGMRTLIVENLKYIDSQVKGTPA